MGIGLTFKSAAVAAAILLPATVASAATVTFSAGTVTGAPNPLAFPTSGTVYQNITATIPGDALSPFEGGDPSDDANPFTSVSANSSATFSFGEDKNQLSFVWGSPDDYNLLTFYNDGVATGETLVFDNNGQNLANPFALINTDLNFDTVVFSSGRDAFEFAQLQVAAIPLPAGVLLLGTALAGLGFARRRKAA